MASRRLEGDVQNGPYFWKNPRSGVVSCRIERRPSRGRGWAMEGGFFADRSAGSGAVEASFLAWLSGLRCGGEGEALEG